MNTETIRVHAESSRQADQSQNRKRTAAKRGTPTLTDRNKRNKQDKLAKRLMLPGIIVTAVITQIPFLGTLFYSFFNWNIMRPDLGMRFNGIGNFVTILEAPEFYTVLENTVILTVASLLICLVLGMFLALLLNRDFFGKGFLRTLIISPFFIMPAVSGVLWKNMIFNPMFGLLAWMFKSVGLPPVDLAANHPLSLVIYIVTWEWTPFFMLVLLAGLQSVPGEIIESSMLDGATRVQQFFHIIIPHLMRYIEVAVFLGLVFILSTFGEIYVATQGGPGYASTNLSYYVFREQIQNSQYGLASAIAVIIVILSVACMTLLFRTLRKQFGGTLA
ncbi:sugar ABC transporter permease [Fodinisporobacter ferrooxydans]|uniref:Sugar ABC transporter permease n=1 Tax=Fodinisporobacter ferrooxydans TaxID=2901836 RepID=A0ABY4CKP7_9BACL|nr:sugar ABC transporter permease [Alicyclobacillaceae bacterium MYW30-H2]